MAYTKTSNLQSDFDEDEMVTVSMKKPTGIGVASDTEVEDPSSVREMHIVATCDGCIHQHVCKYKDKYDIFKRDIEEAYEDACGSEFMDLVANIACGYYFIPDKV